MASSRIRLALLVGALAGTGTAAQQSDVTFEVAAIYPVSSDAAAAGRSAGRLSRMVVTPSRVEITNLSLSEIVRRAFDVRPWELIAPDWMDELHFDIQATLPPGAGREEVPEMLQALLSERFHLTTDLERREMPAYAVMRGMGDLKLAPAPETAPNAGGMRCFVTIGETRVCAGENRTIELFERLAARMEIHATVGLLRRDFDADAIRRSQTAAMRIDIAGITMADLAYELGPFMGRPVFDRTGLSGEYHVSFVLPEGSFQAPIESTPDTLPVFEGRGALGRSLKDHGLTLESRRMLVDVIVVKSISRSPTPN